MSDFSFDPFDSFRKMSIQMEKQMNDSIKEWTNNKDFLGFMKIISDFQTKYTEQIKENQEMFLEGLNMPTQSDIQAVSLLAVQAEEKIDGLEEQVWELQDSVNGLKEELSEVVKVSKQLATTNRQLKNETSKLIKEQEAFREKTNAPTEKIEEIRNEIAALKSLLVKKAVGNESKETKELVTVSNSN